MAFLASNVLPEQGYSRARQLALQAQSYCQARAAQFASTTNADVILGTFIDLKRWHDELNTIKTIPGIAQYARDQENDQAYDVVSEFQALIDALNAALTNIFTTFPKDGNGYLIEKKLLVDGTYEFNTFSPAQLATLVGLLGAVSSAVI